MILQPSGAGRAATRLAAGGRGGRPAALLLAAGLVSLVAGAAILLASLAPLFGLGAGGESIGGHFAAPVTKVIQPFTGLATSSPSATDSAVQSGVITDGPVDGVAFELTIPALGYRATVFEGVSEDILNRGPGHYPDSAWPGQPGNVGVAAHNVYWLSFARLKAGDRVEIRTRHGLFVYEITGSRIVSPDDRSVLTQTPDHRLTLTTCYPLWAGAFATQRLIFVGREIGPS